MSTTTPPAGQSAANIKTARHYFLNMFERHDPENSSGYCNRTLDRAIISLDSRFSVQAEFVEVWHGLINTPQREWRYIRTIFCLQNKDDINYGSSEKEYFVLPVEAMVTTLSDKEPQEAIMSFYFDNKAIEFPDKEVRDDIKACIIKKPSIKPGQKEENSKGSYVASLRISEIPGSLWAVKEALDRMDANFQKAYSCIMEVRSMQQSKVQDGESAPQVQEPEADESNTKVEPPNQKDSNKTKPSSSTKSTKSKTPSPKKPSPKSTDTTNNDKKCSYCARKTTPMWRRGPAGPGTLCNACGVKWRHGKILCDHSATETAASPSIATTENVDPLNTTESNSTRSKRKYTRSTEPPQPVKKKQKKITKKDAIIDLVQDETSESASPPSSSGSPHSINLNTLIMDEVHHTLGLDAVEAATVLTLLKRS
ncbi:MAP kinase kinase Wis1 [Mucor velutinosus]|uniref:MAP kinase kinase Wis1 n=1 Tax=Mucor velutinosus TaxID=708070 RepID=A0AAN7DTG7_9FUNG|nr:MAP kinase kinase Wis1 [Mucor velutinosus]